MFEGACIVVARPGKVNPNLPFCIGALGCASQQSSLSRAFGFAFTSEHLTLLRERETTVRKFSMDRESKLVERIGRAFRSGSRRTHDSALRLGIGDDAAVISSGGKNDWVLSCDAFLEGVHFLAKTHPADSVGYKSLVRATSDLAAMGATPRYFLLTLAIPANRTGVWLEEFLNGMARAASSLKIVLAGGDTTKSSVVSISITVVGEIGRGQAVTRSGARPGDIIYVSGTLGRAQLGLELLLHRKIKASGLRGGRAKHSDRALQSFLRPHLYPNIRLALGAWLAKRRMASAMMDVSD